MPAPTEISSKQLLRLIGTPECPRLIDVCIPQDVAVDPRHIPGAERHSHEDLEALVTTLNGQRAVVICQKGLKLSAGVAAFLRAQGIAAEKLTGGHVGWAADGHPLIPDAVLPSAPGSLWVTRHRPKIDRIACPWLIRRFVDREAKFLYVAPDDVAGVAERFDAIPFDVAGTPWSHQDDRCTFDTMLERFGLQTPPLSRMAEIIRAADLGQNNAAPEAAGLLALSVGLSRQYRDDIAQLEAGLPVYDALYRWAREGQEERHAWPH